MLVMGFVPAAPDWLVMGTPSITIRGSLVAERGTAADTDGCAAHGVTAVGSHDHAGACAYEQILSRFGYAGFDFVGFDDCYGACCVGFFDGTVTDHDEFVHSHSVGLQAHGDPGAAFDGDGLSVASDVGDCQDGVGSDLKLEVTVDVGGYAHLGALDFDTRADGGFTFRLEHGAVDRDFLR